MKKLLVILSCILLCGCSNQAVEKKKEATEKKVAINSDLQLEMKEWKYLFWNGDGNEDGYYRIAQREVEKGDSISNLRYFDYKTKQEVYLCDKPECLHNDETCTSYLEDTIINSTIFVYQDHLYLTSFKGSDIAIGGNQNYGANLYQMDLDGKNRKIIWSLDEGENFDQSTILVGGNKLYIPIEKEELYETVANSSMSVVKERKLMVLDLQTKKAKEVMDLKDKEIIGVDNNQIVLCQSHYQDDPSKYLESGEYEKYNQAMLEHQLSYYQYDLKTNNQSEQLSIDEQNNERGAYYRNKIYWVKKGQVSCLDLKSGKYEELVSLENKGSYSISYIIDNHLVIDLWRDNAYFNTSIISLDNLEVKTSELYKRAPKEPVDILNVCQDYLLVRYDHEGKNETTWAGTDQFEVSKEYYGLISKDDFWNNQANYQSLKEVE